MKSTDAFFAYAAEPALRAETLRQARASLVDRGIVAQTWEDLVITGKVLINEVCAAIDSSATLVADVSTINNNVLFEVGYALAKGKVLFLVLDHKDVDAVQAWKDVSLLEVIGRSNYGGLSDEIVSAVMSERPHEQTSTLFEELLVDGKPRESGAIFAPTLPTKFNASVELERLLSRQRNLKILGAGDDLGLAPLGFYVREIYRSSAAIFHLLPPSRERSIVHNARASLLAGFSYGLGLPTLMVAAEGFQTPLDYKDILFVYPSSKKLQDHVLRWLSNLPKSTDSQPRSGKLSLKIELPVRTFGQFVAEYEEEDLQDYFVPTAEFEAIIRGGTKVFSGRKGTGKTATMLRAVQVLGADKRNLVVRIKPSSYELESLAELASALRSRTTSDYFLLNLWMYLIYTEIALRAIQLAATSPAGIGDHTAVQKLDEFVRSLGIDPQQDISERLESAVAELLVDLADGSRERSDKELRQVISEKLRVEKVNLLRKLLAEAVSHFERVAVLIDNLDKAWEKGADYPVMSQFILSLLSTTGKIEREFLKGRNGLKPINLTLTVFLRADIFSVITSQAREPDKIERLDIEWNDPELLVRVLEDRYAAMRNGTKAGETMWKELFAPEVRGLPARDYFLWRTLPRPRDLIYLGNSALTTAINRKHDVVAESDVTFAEEQYSRFALEALIVESDATSFDLESVLYEFAGLSSTLSATALDDVLQGYESRDAIVAWLVRSSFLGPEVHDGDFVFVQGESNAKRQTIVARRNAENESRDVRFRIHPAFRPALAVRDDDLHLDLEI
jgi:hypothetical protein